MADIVVGAQVKVDSGNAAPTIKEVRENIKSLKTELDNCKAGSNEYRTAMEKLKTQTDLLNPSFGEQGNALKMVKEHLSSSVPAFGQAAEGAKGFGATLKALMANPIVLLIAAIVAGLKFLYDAFRSTREGAEKLEQIFDGLKAAIQVIYDRIMSFGSAIIKLFTGDFSGAFSDAKAAVTGLSDAIGDAYDRAVQISARLQQLKKEQIADDVDRSKRERDLALIREKLNDETVPIKERLAAAKKLRDEQVKNSEDDLKRTTEISNLKIEKLKMERDGEQKNAEEIAELQKSIYDTQKENALEGVRTNKVIRNLEKQDAQEAAAAEKEIEDKAKDARQQADAAEKTRRENMRAFSEKLLNLQQQNELNAIRDGYAKKLKEAEFAQQKELAIINEDLRQGKISAAQKAALLVESQKAYHSKVDQITAEHQKEVAGKEKEFQKELAAAQGKANLDGIADARQKERAALDQQLTEHTQTVLDNEKYTQEQKDKLIAAYQEENHKAQQTLTAKYQKEDEAKEKELAQKEIALKIAMSKKKFDLQRQELDFKQKLIDDQYNKEVAAAQGNALKLREIELKHNEDSFAITQSRIALSKSEREAKLADADAVGSALGAISNLIGQQTVVGKGLAIAQALINTYTGATKALAQGGIAGIAGAIAVTAAGIASVQKIVATQIPGQGSGGSVPSGALSASAPLQARAVNATTTLDQTSINAIGNATSRAFVLDSDVQNNREKTERLNRAARIG